MEVSAEESEHKKMYRAGDLGALELPRGEG